MRALWFIGGAAVGGVATFYAVKYLRPFLMAGGPEAESAIKHAAAVHVRQIRRYAFASSQDLSPIVGLTHASYALVLLDTLEELVGQEAIKKAGYDPKKIRKFITEQQDRHAENLKACDTHLQKVLEIERADPEGQLPGFVLADADELPAARQPWHPDPRPPARRPAHMPNVRNGRGLFGDTGAMSAPRGA
jgi:hypothetical protein